jgi:hypothetical protein
VDRSGPEYFRAGVKQDDQARAAWAGFAAAFFGSTLSHFKHRRSVRPLASVIAINLFLQFGQRVASITVFPPSRLVVTLEK